MVRMMTVANTGRRTQILASHCMASSLHPGAVAHVGAQLSDHLFAALHPPDDGDVAPLRITPGLPPVARSPPAEGGAVPPARATRRPQPILEPPAHCHEHVSEVPV